MKKIFDEKLKSNCPTVLKSFDDLGVSTEVFILDWVFTAFTRAFSLKTARVFWDIWLVFGDYYLLRLAYSIFTLMRYELSEATNMKNGLHFIRQKTTGLQLTELLKIALREHKSPADFRKQVERKLAFAHNHD